MIGPIDKLIREFSKLPGVGHKLASKLAFYVIEAKNMEDLTTAISNVKESVTFCPSCFSYSLNNEKCSVCEDYSRDKNVLCVIEKPQEVFILNRGAYNGMYHVLHGLISPIDGVGPEDIKIFELIERVKREKINEVIIALTSTVEAEATILYLARELAKTNVKLTRLARGVPAGVSIDYLDDFTINKAIEDRQSIVC